MSKTRFNNLFEGIIDINNLDWAFKKSMKGKNRFNRDAIIFSANETHNINKLRQQLIDGTYTFSGYKRFMVHEPKERIIDAPYHVDKVVQLATDRVLKRVYQPAFIFDSYACLDGKGTHKAVKRVSEFFKRASVDFGKEAFIIKLDVRRFFYTVDRPTLKTIVRKKIKCRKTLSLIDHIIDSADAIDPLGMPLGNTLSQLLTNVYMNEFDQFCKRKLKLKYYIRYADDVISIVKNKDEALLILETMSYFLKTVLKLDVHPGKSRVFPIEQGVNAYGFKIYRTHRLLRDDSKKKIKRKTKKMPNLIRRGKLSKETAETMLNSWYGHAMYGSSYNFVEKLKRRNPFIYQDSKGRLKIDENIIKEGVI